MKRWLYLIHRWTGIAVCLLMAAWFFSGVVMMYVGYPKLTPQERLARLPPLAAADCCAAGADALRAAGIAGPLKDLRLTMIADRPHYLVQHGRDAWTAIDARSARARGPVSDSDALAAARAYAPGTRPRLAARITEDAWTHSRALDAHRPLLLVEAGDTAGTELYVSSRTGEVVRDSTRAERGWNYVGAWLHWLYMFRGNRFDAAWHDIIVWTSGIGTATAVIGLWIGILRLRLRGVYRKGGSHLPYREPWMRWHHVLGLAFSLACILWVFSGLMSVNPGKVTSSKQPPPDALAFAGGHLDAAAFTVPPAVALRVAATELGAVKELQFAWFDTRPWYVAYGGNGATRIVAGDRDSAAVAMFDHGALFKAAARTMPAARVLRESVVTAYDNWYLERAPHTMLGHVEKRLPVLRVEFDDPEHTWLHLDPYTGTIHNRIDDPRRLARWSFAALHSWDVIGLIDRRPLWDALMILFSAGGFALCATSVVIGWRRLRRNGRRIARRLA